MINSIDHIVLTTYRLDACIHFYTQVLQFSLQHFGQDRIAFKFGNQKSNVHEYGKEIEPKAHLPVPGSLDICFVTQEKPATILAHLQKHGIKPLEGPVNRTGAQGSIESIYLRDPDLNLIEIARYIENP